VRLVCAHARASSLELLRYPSFSIPTLTFPAIFFLFFVSTRVGGGGAFGAVDAARANLLLASYVGFALLGVSFFQFGVGIAAERTAPWERFLRTLPVSTRARFAARIATALAFGLVSSLLVVVVALVTTPADIPLSRWPLLASAALLGSVPFALLGIAIGYWTTPRGALPLANLLFLGLAFAGGLWTTEGDLPGLLRDLAPVIPTHPYATLLWSAAGGTPWRLRSVVLLVAYGVVFAAVAVSGYRRDEGEQFK
jgi:ABC-2 type transport system permease protein